MFESVLRKLARDQWVRLHGTPRVTVLVGGGPGREIWEQWAALSGLGGALLEGDFDERVREAVRRAVAEPAQPIAVRVSAAAAVAWRAGRDDRLAAMVDEGWIEIGADGAGDAGDADDDGTAEARSGAAAMAGGAEKPAARAVAAGRAGAAAKSGAGSAGGTAGATGAETSEGDVPGRGRAMHVDARSAAEAALFEALEATPATAGRFALNESLAVRFGASAAEVDLLSRGDRIAIEIDGVHHFADLDGYRRDRKKDVLLQGQGLFVVRVLAEDVMRDVRAAMSMVMQALAYRLKERDR
jgi:very-short-patch-repair endonuclease